MNHLWLLQEPLCLEISLCGCLDHSLKLEKLVITNSYHLVCFSTSLEFYDSKVFDDPKVISNGIMDFNDQRSFDDFKVFDDPKVIQPAR